MSGVGEGPPPDARAFLASGPDHAAVQAYLRARLQALLAEIAALEPPRARAIAAAAGADAGTAPVRRALGGVLRATLEVPPMGGPLLAVTREVWAALAGAPALAALAHGERVTLEEAAARVVAAELLAPWLTADEAAALRAAWATGGGS